MLPMTGFEPGSSDIGSNRSANWAITTARYLNRHCSHYDHPSMVILVTVSMHEKQTQGLPHSYLSTYSLNFAFPVWFFYSYLRLSNLLSKSDTASSIIILPIHQFSEALYLISYFEWASTASFSFIFGIFRLSKVKMFTTKCVSGAGIRTHKLP